MFLQSKSSVQTLKSELNKMPRLLIKMCLAEYMAGFSVTDVSAKKHRAADKKSIF